MTYTNDLRPYSAQRDISRPIQHQVRELTVTYALGLPSTDLVDYVGRTLDRSQPIAHRMTEAVHGAFLRGVLLDPFVQCCTGRVGICDVVPVVSWEGKLAVPDLSHNAFGGPERGSDERNGS